MRHGLNVCGVMNKKDDLSDSGGIVFTHKSQVEPVKSKMEGQTEQDGINMVTNQTQCLNLVGSCIAHGSQDNISVNGGNLSDAKLQNKIKEAANMKLIGNDSENENRSLDNSEEYSNTGNNCDTFKPDYPDRSNAVYRDKLLGNTDESSDEASSDNVESTRSSESDFKVLETTTPVHKKQTKRRSLQIFLPTLKRSQSADCDKNVVDVDVICSQVCRENSRDHRDYSRRIHKTCSADAAVINSDVLPIDPQEFMKNKQKSSIAKNMRKKFQKLKRRNTDSLLGAITTVRGTTTKVTRADAVQWADSFDSLLADKNGLEMFRNFLKSEFSEENIEFWIACEDFKTVRTNKLVSTARKIYSNFIATSSPKQVNLDSKTRLDTVTNLDNPTRDLFKQAQKRIQFLMENDSYKRFLDSDIYRHFLRRYSSADGR